MCESVFFFFSYYRILKHYLVLALCGQMSYGFFRCIGAVTRNHVVSNTVGCLAVMWLMSFSGYVLSRSKFFEVVIVNFSAYDRLTNY